MMIDFVRIKINMVRCDATCKIHFFSISRTSTVLLICDESTISHTFRFIEETVTENYVSLSNLLDICKEGHYVTFQLLSYQSIALGRWDRKYGTSERPENPDFFQVENFETVCYVSEFPRCHIYYPSHKVYWGELLKCSSYTHVTLYNWNQNKHQKHRKTT